MPNIPASGETKEIKVEIIDTAKLMIRVTQSNVFKLSGIRSKIKNIHATDKSKVEIILRDTLSRRKFIPKPKPRVTKKIF